MLKPISSLLVVAVPLCLALWSCGSDNPPPPPPPTAYDQATTISENPAPPGLSDTLESANVDYSTSYFTVIDYPQFGTLTYFDTYTGDFTYDPDANTVDIDSFTWEVSDQYGESNVATYTIGVGTNAAIHGDRQPVASR